MRRALRAQTPDSHQPAAALGRWLSDHPVPRTIAVFSALPDEVDLSEIIARNADRRWVYPRVTGDHLTFHAVVTPEADLVIGAFGIREPSPTLAEIPIREIDAFLCPSIAFDPRGGRLGRGRGFYDRILAAARPDALKIGVCFPCQIVPDTFPEPHDIPMDAVIS